MMLQTLFFLLMVAFQVWMLIDAIRRQEWIWAIFIGAYFLLFPQGLPLSALLYYFLVYRQRPPVSFGGMAIEIPGMAERRRIKELESQIHHLDKAQHHMELGDIYLRQGKLEKAHTCYRNAVERDPEDIDARAHLGQCLLKMGKPDEALTLLQAVANEDQRHDYGFTLMALAETHAALGSKDSAIQIWERVLEQHSYIRARVQLAELYAGKSDFTRARNLVQEALADEEHSPAFQRRKDRMWIGRAGRLMRQLEEAGR